MGELKSITDAYPAQAKLDLAAIVAVIFGVMASVCFIVRRYRRHTVG